MTTAADIVNQAIEYSGNQAAVTFVSGVWGGQASAAQAAATLYAPTWQMVARQLDPDFARRTNSLTLVVGGTLPPGWTFEYGYPSDCLRLRTLAPPSGSYDPFDPQYIRKSVGLDVIVGSPVKVIFTNQTGALGVYTSSDLTENDWDALFTMAVVRQLANPLAMAMEGRPDYARELLAQALQYEQMADADDESSAKGG